MLKISTFSKQAQILCALGDITQPHGSIFSNTYIHAIPTQTAYSWNIMCQKWEGDCGFLVLNERIIKKNMLKVWKKSWEPFGSCLLNSTANPAKLGWKWAGLAVLFSRYLPNGSHNFFQTFSTDFYHYFIKNPQTTIALGF